MSGDFDNDIDELVQGKITAEEFNVLKGLQLPTGAYERQGHWPFVGRGPDPTAKFLENVCEYYSRELDLLQFGKWIDGEYINKLYASDNSLRNLKIPSRLIQTPKFHIGTVIFSDACKRISEKIVADLPKDEVSQNLIDVIRDGYIDDMIHNSLKDETEVVLLADQAFTLPFIALVTLAILKYEILKPKQIAGYGPVWVYDGPKQLAQ